MRRLLIVCLIAALPAPHAWAQAMRSPPTPAEVRAGSLLAQAGPQTRAFVTREARTPGLTEASARQAALSEGAALGATSPVDIDALVAMVMFQASQDADADLRALEAQMQQTNAQKQAMRGQTNGMEAAQGGGRAQAAGEYAANATAGKNAPSMPVNAYRTYRPIPNPQPNAARPSDSLNAMSDEDSMRLQMAMDRRSKLQQALSNIMKHVSDTDSAITKNLK